MERRLTITVIKFIISKISLVNIFNVKDNYMSKQEIGGFLELEELKHNEEYYKDGLRLQSGRACLGYLIQCKKIRKIHMPYYICDAVIQICQQMGCDISYYSLDENLLSKKTETEYKAEEYYYLVNYFGKLTIKQIKAFHEKYPNLIVDNAQAFFSKPLKGVDTIYTCRKYFGVPDGAYLYTDLKWENQYFPPFYTGNIDYLFGRYEQNAESYLKKFQMHESVFETADICRMSKVSQNLLQNIDYMRCIQKRKENYEYLHSGLNRYSRWPLADHECAKGAFAYPFYAEEGGKLRKYLMKNKIFIPVLWQNVLNDRPAGCWEHQLAENLLALPCDQRYSIEEMKKIVHLIQEYYKDGRKGETL